MKLIVSDTNIFIDLITINLLDTFLNLPYEIHTTDFVLEELHEDQKAVLQSKIASNQIILERLDGNELGNVTSILSQTKSLSLVDCSVYYFSSKLKATLLTGDSALRKFAENKKLEVRGILWIFDEFQAKGLVNGTMLAEKLQFLTTINTRLPKTECEKRIELWK